MPPNLWCHICQRQNFDNAASLALHYYQDHAALFCCQYCNQQFLNAKDRDSHVNNIHNASYWCIFCDERTKKKKKLTNHQKAEHSVAMNDLSCGECDNMVFPDKACFNLHKNYCHGDQNDQQSKNLQGFCLSCFQRYPLGDFRHHLLQHILQGCDLFCSDCFVFIRNSADLDKHAACLEREAKRFKAVSVGGYFKYNLCECGFCASDYGQVCLHNSWCHKEQTCGICKKKNIGSVGMKRHMVVVHNGTGTPNGQPANLASAQKKQSVKTPRQSKSLSTQPPLSTTHPVRAVSNAIGVELPDSPEEITIKEDPIESVGASSTTAQRTSTLKKRKKVQGQRRQRKDSTSSDGGKRKKTVPADKKSTKKSTSSKEAPKRSRVQDKPTTSDSSSSSDSEDEQPQVAQSMPKPAMSKSTMPISQESDNSSGDTSSTSSSEDEPAPKKPNDRLKIPSMSAKPKPLSNVLKIPQPRQNVLSAAANGSKESNRSAPVKRKSMEWNDLLYVCTLCNLVSVYRGSIIRHLENIHQIDHDICPKFCQSREMPKLIYEEEEEDQNDQPSSVCSIGVQAKNTCLECNMWSEKVATLEKILTKVAKQIGKAKKQLEEEQIE